MKNIHVLKTDKQSRLLKDLVDKTYQLKKEVSYGNRFELSLNIYITNDEEIKEGDYVYSTSQDYNIQKVSKGLEKAYNDVEHYSKIILTTDKDLIKDGVQAIDDEFLEWFVKNPSCEYVDLIGLRKEKGYEFLGYEIIIPKEEPYERTIQSISLSEVDKEELKQNNIEQFQECIKSLDNIFKEQETLEEVAERLYPNYQQEIFIKGAKWQSERMYSEEDLEQAHFDGKLKKQSFKQWFKQFKKK